MDPFDPQFLSLCQYIRRVERAPFAITLEGSYIHPVQREHGSEFYQLQRQLASKVREMAQSMLHARFGIEPGRVVTPDELVAAGFDPRRNLEPDEVMYL
jgi:hypothetical protein